MAAEISSDLVDKRMDFLRLCSDRHWQFNEVRRAHFSTMMLLADLGGPPVEPMEDGAEESTWA